MKNAKKLGKQSYNITSCVSIQGYACVGGKKESEGPFGPNFDIITDDGYFGEKTWEKAESKMQKEAVIKAVSKSGKSISDIDTIFAGDLLNQCIGSSYGLRELEIPFYGLYGACSTMAESLSMGAIMIDGGFASNVVCGTSSHFCSSERQFRMPLEYGGQRPFTAQCTATASGMAVLSNNGNGPYITHITTGKITDKGIKDGLNMGAAMAPAAVDTLLAHFEDLQIAPSYYDLIVTGDLGKVGYSIVMDLMAKNGVKMNNYNDCGIMLYNNEKQDTHAGGSGCGCSAAVLCAHLLPEMEKGRLNKILFIGTGALMSPTSIQQGESIPGIAHAVVISNERQG
ncbi:MAG: stage V sporulation protein AD [Clostridia bacterium]|nr:stage V sporulation protein AD [Clostridia bacterium]